MSFTADRVFDTDDHEPVSITSTSVIEHVAIPAINQTFDAIGKTPLDPNRVKLKSYGERKLRQLQAGVRETLHMNKPKDDFEEILSQLKVRFKDATRSEIIQILTILPKSWSIRQIEQKFKVTHWMAQTAKNLQVERGVMTSPNPKPGRKLNGNLIKSIHDFYLSDTVSRVMPGIKDYVSVYSPEEERRIHKQKQLVLCNLKEAYQQFRTEFPEVNVGFSKFAELRPKECVLAGASGTHCVCVCTIHQNVKLMLNALNDKVKYEYPRFLAIMSCNPGRPECFLGQCGFCPGTDAMKQRLIFELEEKGLETMTYKQWTSTDRCDLITIQNDLDEYCDILCAKLKILGPHDFIVKQQSQFLRSLKEQLEEGHVIMLSDFSEIYGFVIQDAAQGYHWTNSQATPHPSIAYYKKNGTLKSISCVMVSDSLVHDTIAVSYFQKRLLSVIKSKVEPKKIFYFSDGAAAQYKNRKNFANLAYHEEDYGVPAEWHFFATSHGKGPCDGIGGTVKRLATKASLQRTLDCQIQTPHQLYEWAQDNIAGVTTIFCPKGDIAESETFLKARLEKSFTVAGTQKLHAFYSIHGRHQLEVKRYSNSGESRTVNVVKV